MKVIIFGSSGDLAKRKLFPALSKVDLEGVEIVGYARTKYDVRFSEVLQDEGNYSAEFLSKVTYVRGLYDDLSGIRDAVDGETVFYFSVPPSVYIPLLREISKLEHKAVAIEKPYGDSRQTFEEMKKCQMDNVIFVDHYLLKPLVVAMPKLIRECGKIQRLLDSKSVGSVEIVSKEVIGGEGRHYFDRNGIIKDIVQNHMAELLGVAASDVVEASERAEAGARVEVFSRCTVDAEHCVYGQYESYSKELHKESDTETFCVVPVYVDSARWSRVPFIIIAGKGMDEKRTEIVFEFRREAFAGCIDLIAQREDFLYRVVHTDDISAVRLVFNVHPRREVFLEIRTGEEDLEYVLYDKRVVEEIMHSRYGNYHDHEIVFNGLIKDIGFNRVNSVEAEQLWRIFDPIISLDKGERLFYYSKGVDMPVEAEEVVRTIKNR